MKITFNVECTPEEARDLLGLPDFGPMQTAITQELEKKIKENMQLLSNPLDPQGMFKSWLNPVSGFEQLQNLFWGQTQKTLQNLTENTVNNVLSYSQNNSGNKPNIANIL